MKKLKKCPICELNYIAEDEDCCNVCKPENQDKLISTEIDRCYSISQDRMKYFNDCKKSMKQYLTIRYNKVIR